MPKIVIFGEKTPARGIVQPQLQGLNKKKTALAWLACLLCLALAWSGLSLPCQQQQPAAFGGRRRLRRRCCCCWTRPRQGRRGRQDRPRPDQAKARHNKQASQAKAAILDQNLDLFFPAQNCPKRALGARWGPGGPWGPYCPLFFPPFSPLWGPLFFLLDCCGISPY